MSDLKYERVEPFSEAELLEKLQSSDPTYIAKALYSAARFFGKLEVGAGPVHRRSDLAASVGEMGGCNLSWRSGFHEKAD